MPGVEWPQIRNVALVGRDVLADFGLAGWPKTSGSRGIHIYVRIPPRWAFADVRRAAVAVAREMERRAPELATSKWWKEERHGVFVDYNQNAKDRTVASAYSLRPLPDARVSAPLTWDEVPTCDPADVHRRDGAGAVRADRRPLGGMDEAAGPWTALLELRPGTRRRPARRAVAAPLRKQTGEAARVQPSKRRTGSGGAGTRGSGRGWRGKVESGGTGARAGRDAWRSTMPRRGGAAETKKEAMAAWSAGRPGSRRRPLMEPAERADRRDARRSSVWYGSG